MRKTYVREAIGIEIAFGKYQFVESVLFVEYPILFSAGLIAIGIVIMPTGDLVQQLVVQREFQSGVSRIEMVQDRLIALAPLPQKYPFVVLGISSNESSQHVTEMTSALDQYLMRYIGLSLMEMALEKERSKYDFKVVLPTENVKIAKLASAFANHTGGGWVLLGVDDEGTPVGILRCDLDAIQQRITNIIRDSCSPRPECCFEVIEMPRDPTKCILIVHIAELERKPCLVEHRAYVRRGTESVAADSEEIRRLIVRENSVLSSGVIRHDVLPHC